MVLHKFVTEVICATSSCPEEELCNEGRKWERREREGEKREGGRERGIGRSRTRSGLYSITC